MTHPYRSFFCYKKFYYLKDVHYWYRTGFCSYKSLSEALVHAGIRNECKVTVRYIDSENLIEGDGESFDGVDAILVPGGFGGRGIEGMIAAARYARERQIPYLGICLGLQIAVIECARHLAGLTGAHSTEFASDCPDPVIALVTEWMTDHGWVEKRDGSVDLGGTMRLGAQECVLEDDSIVAGLYQTNNIFERHRHRYEVNEAYVPILKKHGLLFQSVLSWRCRKRPGVMSKPFWGARIDAWSGLLLRASPSRASKPT